VHHVRPSVRTLVHEQNNLNNLSSQRGLCRERAIFGVSPYASPRRNQKETSADDVNIEA